MRHLVCLYENTLSFLLKCKLRQKKFYKIVSWSNRYITFFVCNLQMSVISKSVCSYLTFQVESDVYGKAWVFPSERLPGAPLSGRLLALPTNIRLDRKGILGISALVYYKHTSIMAVKSLISLSLDVDILRRYIKHQNGIQHFYIFVKLKMEPLNK